MNESDISQGIIAWIQKQPQCHARKIHSGGMDGRGEPDILACIHGHILFIETKVPISGKITSIQEYCLSRWRNAGADVMIATSLRQVKDRVDAMRHKGVAIQLEGIEGYDYGETIT